MGVELMLLGDKRVIAVDRIIAIASPDSAPIKRVINRADEEGLVINVTYGLKIGAVIFMDSGHVVLASSRPEEIVEQLGRQRGADWT